MRSRSRVALQGIPRSLRRQRQPTANDHHRRLSVPRVYLHEVPGTVITDQDRKLVFSIVRTFNGHGLERRDLVQEGLIAVLRAHKTYDVSRGVAFSTWAYIAIRRQLVRAIRDYRFIRIPESTIVETKREVRDGTLRGRRELAVIGEDGKPRMRTDLPITTRPKNLAALPAGEVETPDPFLARRVSRYLDRLDPRERRVVEGVYVREETCLEMSKELGVTRARVDQLHHQAIGKMRRWAQQERVAA